VKAQQSCVSARGRYRYDAGTAADAGTGALEVLLRKKGLFRMSHEKRADRWIPCPNR
jgi:hypothetical protein